MGMAEELRDFSHVVGEAMSIQISPPTVTPSGPGKSVTIARVSLWPHMILQEEGG